LRLLVLALSARAALSLADAASLAGTGVGFLHLGGIAQADSSPLWALLWGSLALAATVLLARRRALGWVFGAAVCVVYLVVGVAQAVMWDVAGGSLPLGAWLVFGADIMVPALVLAGMFTVRPWFLAHARRGRRKPLGQGAPATGSSLEAERRRP
jgi:hypothetical protein